MTDRSSCSNRSTRLACLADCLDLDSTRRLLLACLLHNLNNSTRFLIIFIICRPRNNRRKPGEVRIFTTEQLAAIVPPRKFLRVVVSKTIVYEADKNEYFNPHGVGPYFGEIINPFGLEKEVHWADDDQTMTSTSYLRDAQARNLQIEAHKCYMLAIGLESNQLDKEIAKKPKAKKKTKKTTKITVRTNPPRGAKNANNGDPNDAAPAAEIGEQTKESDIAWIKCRDPPLESAELLKLKPALKRLEGSQYWQPRFSRAKYYAFAHRVCRAYRLLWLKQKRDPAHLNRENLARSAVASVFGQVRPWTDKPHHGNTHMAMLTLLPAIEMVFDIPSYDHNPGTKQWLKKMVTTNRSVM